VQAGFLRFIKRIEFGKDQAGRGGLIDRAAEKKLLSGSPSR